MKRQLGIFVFLLCFVSEAFASETYECIYKLYSDNNGSHADNLKLTFLVDDTAQKSYVIGNNGSDEVVFINRGNGMSFIEVTDLGNVMTTSISLNMDTVHSRNSMLGDKLIPSQYYGVCEKK